MSIQKKMCTTFKLQSSKLNKFSWIYPNSLIHLKAICLTSTRIYHDIWLLTMLLFTVTWPIRTFENHLCKYNWDGIPKIATGRLFFHQWKSINLLFLMIDWLRQWFGSSTKIYHQGHSGYSHNTKKWKSQIYEICQHSDCER